MIIQGKNYKLKPLVNIHYGKDPKAKCRIVPIPLGDRPLGEWHVLQSHMEPGAAIVRFFNAEEAYIQVTNAKKTAKVDIGFSVIVQGHDFHRENPWIVLQLTMMWMLQDILNNYEKVTVTDATVDDAKKGIEGLNFVIQHSFITFGKQYQDFSYLPEVKELLRKITEAATN